MPRIVIVRSTFPPLHANEPAVEQKKRAAIRLNYEHTAGRLLPPTEEALRAKARDRRLAAVRFLDIGPGLGGGLKHAASIPRVLPYGLGPHQPPEGFPPGQFIHGFMEEVAIPTGMHVIQSRYSLAHSISPPRALEQALNSLTPGGKLISADSYDLPNPRVNFGPHRPAIQAMYDALQEEGFHAELPESPDEPIVIIRRGRKSHAELSHFYSNGLITPLRVRKLG